ncbi:Type II secretory pathway, ATPase PulE/Tfp pilus assembly pathway, ATPase PilB [Citrifermentans bremense]|uniref:Type II secretion system protein E n=2 Tax=Geobacteraceae TaxID=213422 RepID=A0ABQ0MPS4_9BACT|nr:MULTISPECIES: GspE/PulE family protein [Geobacteraceae]BCG48483.1 Type II secretory pathway, ATPase PulE/Tfp pilus assembly pathway, ATPase PilB [Citrifermentans bremense]GAW68998.1 type II secretion system protein E [Geoanaerobacter pelophilus]
MHRKKMFTIQNVGQILLQRQMITDEQFRALLAQGEAQAQRLAGAQQAGYSRRVLHAPEKASPAEVIASFNLEIPGGGGKLLTEDAITEVLAQAVGLPYLKINPMKLDLELVTAHISRPFALKHLIVPVGYEDGVVVLAVADPFNEEVVEELKSIKRMEFRRVLASRNDILKILREFFGFRASVQAAESEVSAGVDLGNLEQFVRLKTGHEIEGTDRNIISAVDFLLQYAFDQRASDIHIEPKREKSLVRLRVDGVLHNVHVVPKQLHPPIVSRIKMLSRMDLAEKRRPQDGRIKTSHQEKEVELRVSTLPVAFGEKVVIRIFDPDVLMQELDQIGFYPREYQLYSSFLRRPNGIILVTGPTGSGKTTTLYSSLRTLSSPEVNIVTVEDPIEMVMEEFNQVGVQSGIGVTFDKVLRNVLRQDPDIIMIGEIRDKETAENAVQAALTGHLVLSTLHTNDAPSSVTRLIDLGVPPFLISSTVVGIIAQRLLRKICPACKKERRLAPEELEYLGLKRAGVVWSGEGCPECRGTGYKGRTGIFEVLDVNDAVKGVISERLDLAELQAVARRDGLVTLREQAVRKMLEGISTYEEVIAVTG